MSAAGQPESVAGTIGFVGLGAMGTPMVEQLSAGQRSVLAFDADPARLRAVAELPGVSAATRLGELADVELVVCMLPSSAVVDEVVAGPNGLLDALAPHSLIIDMSSSDPRHTVVLAEKARARGVDLVDAPVSGGVRQAGAGALSVMFGGSASQLERCRWVLECFAQRIAQVGPVGAGHAMKSLNNVSSAVGLAVACEVIEVGRRFGLEPSVMLSVLNSSTGRNHATENKIEQYVLNEHYDSGFLLQLMCKDLRVALALAHETGAVTPISEACLALWERASEVLPVDADQTRIALMPKGLGAPEATMVDRLTTPHDDGGSVD